MGLGVLSAGDQELVPGTSYILDDEARSASLHQPRAGIKYDRSGPVPIILVPQPSDDPNDPLNWPLWRRDLMLVILCIISVIASTLSPLLAANTITLSLSFEKPFQDIVLLTAYHLAGVAFAGFIFVASARVWGKRHLYLFGTVLIIISSAWGGSTIHSRSFYSMLGARIVQGFGLAPFEALVNASVGDLFFVHERGKRMALSNMSLFGGAFFTPILVGKITYSIGWQWSFYLIAIFAGACLPLIFFFVPETAYRRPERFNPDDYTYTVSGLTMEMAKPGAEKSDSQNSGQHSAQASFDKTRSDGEERTLTTPAEEAEPIAAKASYARSLMPFNGRKTDDNFFKLILRPFPLFIHPGVAWACLTQGTIIGWTVLIGAVLALIFLGPPLFFNEVTTGYMYTGAFLGAMFGFLAAGILSDWSAKVMIRRNKGVFEPEFRIVLVIPQLILGCMGLYGFGITANNVTHYSKPAQWLLPDFFFALEVAGMIFGAVASALYIVDAHKDIAVEVFTCLLIFKNIFSFALTFNIYDLLISCGTGKMFYIVSSVQIGVCLLSIPMYVFGKRNRAFMARHDLLKMTGLY